MGSSGAVQQSGAVHDTSLHDASLHDTSLHDTGVRDTDVGRRPPERRPLDDVSLRWSDLGLFVACYIGLVAVWFTLGKVVVNSSAITSLDRSVEEWWIDQRSPDRDTAAIWGSGLAETIVKIGVTALIAIGMRLAWKRWREPLMMVVPLVLEAAAFITVTRLIGRPRPESAMESSPVNSSFPSGHVAAAAAYSALVIVVFWHTRKVWMRVLVIVVSVAVPVVVAVARMYQGMHYLSDVIAGAALGFAAVALSWWIVHRAAERTGRAPATPATAPNPTAHQTATDRTKVG